MKPFTAVLLLCALPLLAQTPAPPPAIRENTRDIENLNRRVETLEDRMGRTNRTPTATYNLERRIDDIEKRLSSLEKKVADLDKLEQRVRKLENAR